MRPERRLLLAAVLVLGPAALLAQGLPAPLASRLATMSVPQRAELQRRQATWSAMPPASRANLTRRMAEWDALPVADQAARREAWTAWHALPLADRLSLRAVAVAFATLPADHQLALRRQFEGLDASDRRGWRLGPVLGVDYPLLQPLLAQVPADQREPLLATLRAMGPGERSDLAVLAQRTPPQERDALRRALLSTAASNRSAWLQARLDR